jgi:hypothetical protein
MPPQLVTYQHAGQAIRGDAAPIGIPPAALSARLALAANA